MIKIEFIQDFKCYNKGDTRIVQPHFAKVLIDEGIAKRVPSEQDVVKAVGVPEKHKMIEEPMREK